MIAQISLLLLASSRTAERTADIPFSVSSHPPLYSDFFHISLSPLSGIGTNNRSARRIPEPRFHGIYAVLKKAFLGQGVSGQRLHLFQLRIFLPRL